MYHDGLKLLHTQFQQGVFSKTEFDKIQLQIFCMLANENMTKGEYSTAENLFKHCIRGFIMDLRFPVEHLAVIEASLKLAIIYASTEKFEEAETGYTFCISTLQSSYLSSIADKTEFNIEDKNVLALYGMCLDAYTRFLIERKRYKESLLFARKAAEVSEKVYDHNSASKLATMNLLGTSLTGCGHTEEAENVFQKCCECAKLAMESFEKQGETDESSEMEKSITANLFCACKCNYASTMLQSETLGNSKSRSAEAMLALKGARTLAERYKDDACGLEIKKCLELWQSHMKTQNK